MMVSEGRAKRIKALTNGNPAYTNTGRFQYTGQLWLEGAGVYHYKNRAYHPGMMRFLQADPIGVAGGINLYAYVGGDPVNFSDPMGLARETIIITGQRWRCDHECHARKNAEEQRRFLTATLRAYFGADGYHHNISFYGGIRGSRSNGLANDCQGNFADGGSVFSHWPVPGYNELTVRHIGTGQGDGGYGYTRDGGQGFHAGIDIAAPVGTTIVAVESGVVTAVRPNPSGEFGHQVAIRHPNDFYSIYTHMQGASHLSVGDMVSGGQAIGAVGRSGNARNVIQSHLHLEIRVDSANPRVNGGRTMNPGRFLPEGQCR